MQQLSFLPGEMTPGERSLIQRALKTLDRHLHEPGVAFTSTRAAREWLILNMAGLEREEFRVLYLNNQNQLIAGETLFTRHNHITPVFTFIFCLQRYPTMKIITRGEAMRIHRQHPASRLFPFCTGKYRWHGSAEAYTGREVQDIPGVLAVFAERRKDSFGPYVRLMSVTLN